MTVSRRHGVALLTGLAVGALLIGATIALSGPRVAPPDSTAQTVLLPLPALTPLPMPPLPVPIPAAPARPRPAARKPPAARGGPEQDVVARTNAERMRAGCPALRLDPRLTRAARAHSADMVDRRYFEHTSPDGTTPDERAAAAGYPELGGENIAYGQRSAAAVMYAWMHSPEHRSNILDCEYTTVGVGLDSRGMYWTQDFGY
ncbi:MAG TPA: CAP domain-containing protein [Pseudonocardia sp.]